jgi:hypothetical protein
MGANFLMEEIQQRVAKNPVLLLAGVAISTAARANCYVFCPVDARCGW